MTLRKLADYGPAFVLLVALLALWELYVRSGTISQTFLPAPTAIWEALFDNWDVISVHTLQTLEEAILGLASATILGFLAAIVLDFSSWARRAIYPLLVTSQTIPLIALAPLLVLWFGFDLGPKIIVITIYCFFPVTVACADGLSGTDPDLLKLMRSMNATRGQILWMVRLPGAMPAFFSGLRIAATYAMSGAIFAEYVGAFQGLGIYMQTSFNSHAVVLVFAAIIVTAVVSILLFAFVSFIERLVLPWHQGPKQPL